jgi:predicted enzyme related to lactoylglutathione lyase
MTIESAAAVFHVKHLAASLKFYTEVLGFQKEFEFGEYAGIKSGGASIHLSAHTTNAKPVGSGHIYLFCTEVDSYYREITSKGARPKGEPKDYPYGMRDFEVEDPDGNFLAFGCESKQA